MTLPAYIETRLRLEALADAPIIPGSTPVLSFGNPAVAKIATVGLNPSNQEFLDRDCQMLEEDRRRLETLSSLKVERLAEAPNRVLDAVVAACNGYFHKNPYSWFNRLEAVLGECGASYYDGTACHLDLVQWATEDKWSRVWPGVRTMMLRQDVPLLVEQLRNSNIRTLLLNGRTVIKEFAAAVGAILVPQPEKIMGKTKIVVGQGPGDVLVVGWSTNLQTSRGVNNHWCREIARAVAAITRDSEIGKNQVP